MVRLPHISNLGSSAEPASSPDLATMSGVYRIAPFDYPPRLSELVAASRRQQAEEFPRRCNIKIRKFTMAAMRAQRDANRAKFRTRFFEPPPRRDSKKEKLDKDSEAGREGG